MIPSSTAADRRVTFPDDMIYRCPTFPDAIQVSHDTVVKHCSMLQAYFAFHILFLYVYNDQANCCLIHFIKRCVSTKDSMLVCLCLYINNSILCVFKCVSVYVFV